MYVCEEFLSLFSISFLFLSLCSVVHYARDCSCALTETWLRRSGNATMYGPKLYSIHCWHG